MTKVNFCRNRIKKEAKLMCKQENFFRGWTLKFDLTIEERVGNRRLFSHSKNDCWDRVGPKR